jgi:hypothetical protein
MSEPHSTPAAPSDQPAPSGKPTKPGSDFPLFAHAAGVWAKKIRGKLHHFGPWSDPEGALRRLDKLGIRGHPRPAPHLRPRGDSGKKVGTLFRRFSD